MKLSKRDKNIIVGASQEKIIALKRALNRELVRRKTVYHPETKAKIGEVVRDMYLHFLVKKTKIRKDSHNILYTKFKERGMWSGNHYVFRDKLRLSHDIGWQSFVLDYANRKRISKLKPKQTKWTQY